MGPCGLLTEEKNYFFHTFPFIYPFFHIIFQIKREHMQQELSLALKEEIRNMIHECAVSVVEYMIHECAVSVEESIL